MQQIAEIRVEMQQKHDPPPPGFASNAVDGRPTKRELDETMNSINLYFSSQNEQSDRKRRCCHIFDKEPQANFSSSSSVCTSFRSRKLI